MLHRNLHICFYHCGFIVNNLICEWFICRYYGYRNPQNEIDPRLKCFANHVHLFDGKDILDIGCNIGHITLSVARDFGAKSVVGIDIDKKLISIARKNIKHYVSSESPSRDSISSDLLDGHNKKSSEFFPISMPILYGPIDIPGFSDQKKGQGFPNNVTFVQVSPLFIPPHLFIAPSNRSRTEQRAQTLFLF